MSKLPRHARFIDLSDYARWPARLLSRAVLNTPVKPNHLTTLSLAAGLWAAYAMTVNQWMLAAALLPFKSMLDAADGELARMRKRPSYVGRYYDALVDFLVSVGLYAALVYSGINSWLGAGCAVILMHLQCSLYHRYTVLQRHNLDGDKTAREDESVCPTPELDDWLPLLRLLHRLYLLIYRWQDKIVISLDPRANKVVRFPNAFLTAVSAMGLGSQLLVMAVLMAAGHPDWIVPAFIGPFTLYGLALVVIRKRIW